MYNQNNDWSKWTTPVTELQKSYQQMSENIARECSTFYTDSASAAVKCMQNMPRITSPEEFVAAQLKVFSQQTENVLEFTQKIFQIYQDALRDQVQWTQDKVNATVKNHTNKNKREEA